MFVFLRKAGAWLTGKEFSMQFVRHFCLRWTMHQAEENFLSGKWACKKTIKRRIDQPEGLLHDRIRKQTMLHSKKEKAKKVYKEHADVTSFVTPHHPSFYILCFSPIHWPNLWAVYLCWCHLLHSSLDCSLWSAWLILYYLLFFFFTKILFCKASSLLEILMRWDYRWDCFLNHLMESAWFKAHQHILSSLPWVFMASVEVKRSSIFSWWFEWKEQQDDDFRIVQKHLNVSYQWSYYYI